MTVLFVLALSLGSVVQSMVLPFSHSPNSSSLLGSHLNLIGSDLFNMNFLFSVHVAIILSSPCLALTGLNWPLTVTVSSHPKRGFFLSFNCLPLLVCLISVLYGDTAYLHFQINCQQLKIKRFVWNSRFLTSQNIDLATQYRQIFLGCRNKRRQ